MKVKCGKVIRGRQVLWNLRIILDGAKQILGCSKICNEAVRGDMRQYRAVEIELS